MARQLALTRAQRNDLYRSLERGGLDLTECDFTETYRESLRKVTLPELRLGRLVLIKEKGFDEPEAGVAEVKHLPSGSTFRIENTAGHADRTGVYVQPSYHYWPSVAGATELFLVDQNWEKVVEAADRWAERVRRECVDPDFWTELRLGSEFFGRAQHPDSSNMPFTPQGQAEIAVRLREIKDYLKETYSLTGEQAARVDRRFDEAEAASRRIGRKDWLLLFGGALFSLLLSAVLPPEAVQHALIMAAQGLGHLFEGESSPQISS